MKAPIDKYSATIILGAAELIGAFTCVLLVHLTGKRPLVFVSLIGTGCCFFGAATYAWYLDDVPGVIIDNIVANHSVPDIFHRTNFVNENNITYSLNASDEHSTIAYETTTFLNDLMSTISYSDELLENDTTTDIVENTTMRFKRMNIFETAPNETKRSNQTDFREIILPLPNAEENKYLWVPLTLLLAGAFFAHIGIRIIPWMLIGEVFPVNVRSAASGLSSGIGYIFAFLSNKMFLPMLSTLTLPGTFWFYSAVALIGCIILYYVLPETEGRKLIDIEAHFLGKKLLSEPQLKSDSNTNGNNNNGLRQGFDMVTVVPQIVNRVNGQNDKPNEPISINETQPHRLSVPDVFINRERSPKAGSKRYKNRVSDTIRSRNSISSNDDVQDTRL